MAKGVTQLEKRLDALLLYLQPNWDFLNCHMVNYLTDQHWTRFLPEAMRNEINSKKDLDLAIENLFWEKKRSTTEFSEWENFLTNAEHEHLSEHPELLTTVDQLIAEQDKASQLNIREFMSAKKCHEVELTAALVDNLIQSTGHQHDFFIVDAGDGKGYLSSRMALQYGHRVLGIDANAANTENALNRNRKLQRAWNGLTERAELQSQGITPKRRGKKSPTRNTAKSIPVLENYKTTARFINTETNFGNLLAEHFPKPSSAGNLSICLTGLHTCGNLAATCLQVFHAQPDCQILCNIGCCYHLLKERYSQQEFFGNKALMEMQTDFGFPLSQYLHKRQIRLGRNARMLAAQSIERTLNGKELPNITLYYRALLEVLVCRHAPHLKNELQVGKVRKFDNFQDYIQKCARKLDAPWLAAIDTTELQSVLQEFALDKHLLDMFYLIRMSFAPVLESLILLDRLLYLKELGYERSYLIDLFDPVISPRHFAIVALKTLP
ncbi:methyltransferase-like protein 25 isoform X1 [Drosophila miranda]|uniref:methyltransferase-like protein 25 isoform X1 n=1 Tax=Drosophila miranda TaxID=7229 RepID=UPI0007E61D6B|nr:methyltransferase-like protein 25 isoform X1 [Drosophila miranda]